MIAEHHLYNLVSDYLKAHPTTPAMPLRLRIQGMPHPEGPLPPPAVPKGYKINEILPLHSPAVSGGGVSENILRDMMQGMSAIIILMLFLLLARGTKCGFRCRNARCWSRRHTGNG